MFSPREAVKKYLESIGFHNPNYLSNQPFIPSEREIREVQDFIRRLKSKVTNFYYANGIPVKVYEVGSTAKGTFVRGDFDVDIYVLTYDPERAFKLAKYLFPQGKQKFGALLIWHFIENHFDVDLVFAHPESIKTETLKHTPFFRRYLTPEMKHEVAKAKAFFKTRGVYSAEIGGITGVAIEELIRRYKTLDNVCRYLASCKEKPFIQDPVVSKPRNLLASIIPKRWKQIQEACREYLQTRKIRYKPFSEEDFRRRYWSYMILEFNRRLDKATDFFTARSITLHAANFLRNFEPECRFDYDVFVTGKKILIAIDAQPKHLTETKKICIHSRFEKAIEKFILEHPNAYREGEYICAYVKRKFTNPLEAYANEIIKRMKERGYDLI